MMVVPFAIELPVTFLEDNWKGRTWHNVQERTVRIP